MLNIDNEIVLLCCLFFSVGGVASNVVRFFILILNDARFLGILYKKSFNEYCQKYRKIEGKNIRVNFKNENI